MRATNRRATNMRDDNTTSPNAEQIRCWSKCDSTIAAK